MTRAARTMALGLILPILLVVLWWVLSADSTSVFFPPLSEIVARIGEVWLPTLLIEQALPSVVNLAIGYTVGILVGSALGILLGLFPRGLRDLSPVIDFLRALPIAALVPVALISLGPGLPMEVALIAFGSIWPVLLNAADGVRAVDRVALEMAQVYGLSRRQRILRIVLPYTLPPIFAGMRISVAIAVIVMIVANMVGSTSGLGYSVVLAQNRFDMVGVWAAVIVTAIIGMLVNASVLAVEAVVLRWYRQWRRTTDDRS